MFIKKKITMKANAQNFNPTEFIYYNTNETALEVHWKRNVPDNKIEQCISLVKSLVNITHAKELLIDGLKLRSSDFGLNWKIIENTWKAFFENGGKKVRVITGKRTPKYLLKEYLHSIKEYGIPLDIRIERVHK